MSRFLTAPQLSLSAALGVLIFSLKAKVELKVQDEINTLIQELQNIDTCKNEAQLRRIKTKVSNIKSFLDKSESRASKFQKTLEPLNKLALALSAAIVVLELLPVPNIGTTVGVTNKFSDLLAKLKKFSNEVHDEVFLLTGILVGATGLIPLLTSIKVPLNRIDGLIKECAEGTAESTGVTFAEDSNITTPFEEENFLGYKIQVETVDTSKVAPLRQAVAFDRDGIKRFTSERSFSSSTEVLVKEVKFKIENNILS